MISSIKKLLLLLILIQVSHAEVEVIFFGNQNFSDKKLTNQLDLPENLDTLDDQSTFNYLNLAKYNLEVLYENAGYFSYDIKLSRDKVLPDRFIYEIFEGTRYIYEEVQIVDKSKNLEVDYPIDFPIPLESKSGQFYDGEKLSDDLAKIIFEFKDRGYLEVQIFQSLLLDEEKSTIKATFEAFPGPQIRFNQLEISTRRKRVKGQATNIGLSSQAYLKSLWSVPQGEIIRGDYWVDFRQNLLSTGIYSSVQLKAKPISVLDTLSNSVDTLYNVQLSLVERTPGSYQGNIFYEQLLGFGVSLTAKHKNVNGGLNEVSLGGALAQNRKQVSAGYGHPFLFKTPYRFSSQITLRQDSLPDPTEPEGIDYRREIISSSTVSRKFNENVRFLTLGDLRQVNRIFEDEVKVKLRIEPSLQLQFTDKLTDPTLGSKFRFAVGNGGTFKMEERFFYTQVESDFYLPLGNRLFWAGSADWGKFFQTGDRDDAKLFYLGGFRSIRGYGARSIAPFKDSTYVQNGDTVNVVAGPSPEFLRLSNEFRYNTAWLPGLQVVQFTDWGKILDLSKSYRKDQQMAVGLGVRWQISLLTLRLDYTLKKDFFKPFEVEDWELGRISFDLSQAI